MGFPFFYVRILLLLWNSSTAFFKKQCYKIEFNNFYGILKILMEKEHFHCARIQENVFHFLNKYYKCGIALTKKNGQL